MQRKTNWLAVVVAAVSGMLIGFLWYGALFQAQWSAAHGFTMEGEHLLKDGVEVPMSATPMIFNTVAMILYALLINWLLGRAAVSNWMDGAKIGGVIGLIMLLGIFVGNMFAQSPSVLSMIDGSYSLVMLTLMGAILGGWTKK